MIEGTVACPVCGNAATDVFCDRPAVPVHQNYLLPDAGAAVRMPRGHLRMVCCPNCGFVFNDRFRDELLDYGQQYENTQTWSAAFEDYVDGLVDRVLTNVRKPDVRFVEVGCGKGRFLTKLVQRAGRQATGVGFDPTYVGPLDELQGRLRFERRFYDAEAVNTPADIVVCRHVIEHVPRPLQLLDAVHEAIGAARQATVFFETPCVNWILRHRVVWDLFYEHCSLFTDQSLAAAFGRAGFHVQSVDHVFGGQYLWLQARLSGDPTAPPDRGGGDIAKLASAFRQFETSAVPRWRKRIEQWAKTTRFALWGAGAKGVTLANLADPDATLINCVVDVNPNKQGHYLPGTGHPIVAPEQLAELQVGIVGVTNPNYLDEIRRRTSGIAPQIEVQDLMQGM